MSQLIINGDVAHIKDLLRDAKQQYDDILYLYKGKYYYDVQDIFAVLLNEQNYVTLKNFNECVFWAEFYTDLVSQRTHRPMNMQIEHTSFCNARCIMCFHYYYANKMAFNMEESVFFKCQKWLPFVRLVGLHGFGEPFLSPNLSMYLDDYHYYGVKLYTNTNLSIIPPYLHEYYSDFQFINISCDGATKEVFEGIRQNMSFEKFIKNIKKVRKEAPDLQLNFSVVLMRQNLYQCEQMVRLAAELGINKVMFSKVGINYVIANYEDSVDEYPKTLRNNLKVAYETGLKLGVEVLVPCSIKELYEDIDKNKLDDEQDKIEKIPFWNRSEQEVLCNVHGSDCTNLQLEREISNECFCPTSRMVKGICDWITNNIYISATGRVGFCCSNFKYFIGDLNYESLDEIWNGDNYRRLTEVFKTGKLPFFCRNCNLLEKRMLPGITEII